MNMAQKLNKTGIHSIFESLDKEIDESLEQPSTKFVLIAVGGTSLTLRNIKSSTKDVDLMVDGIELSKVKTHLRQVCKKNKCKIDIWQSPHIFSTTLLENFTSDLYPRKYKHFDVKIVNLVDNAVAKLSRFNEADREDIDGIIRFGVNPTQIVHRFEETLRNNGFANRREAETNLNIFRKVQNI